MNTPSPLPRSTTLVSPVTTSTPASFAVAAIERLKRRYPGCKIVLSCIFAAREGLEKVAVEQPDVPIYTAFVSLFDLDARGYIQDGPGDAGDRAFGPKPAEEEPELEEAVASTEAA